MGENNGNAPDDANSSVNHRYYRVTRCKWTFEDPTTKKWVESWLNGRVLNAFAGQTFLRHNNEIIRNDANPDNPAGYHKDVVNLRSELERDSFDTIVHDPPWSNRQAEKSYDGYQSGEVGATMKLYDELLKPGGHLISLGYTVTTMPAGFGYDRQELAIFETIGRGDDYFGAVVRKMNTQVTDY